MTRVVAKAGPAATRELLIALVGRNDDVAGVVKHPASDGLLSLAFREGVVSQAHQAMGRSGPMADCLPALRAAALAQGAASLRLRNERDRVLQHLASLDPVLLKGEALARRVYPAYGDRPAGDMDILVLPHRAGRAGEILRHLGYRPATMNSGSLVMPQHAWSYDLDRQVVSVVDLHTHLFNRPALRDLLGHDALYRAGDQAAGLPPGIVLPGREHLLLHAALHLVGHHAAEQRLIWLLDIRLLANALDAVQRSAVLAFCREHGMSALLCGILDRVEDTFPGDNQLRDALSRQIPGETDQWSYLLSGVSDAPIRQAIADWQALRGAGERLTWLRQHLFPRKAYMKSRYDVPNDYVLPCFYLWRILRGGVKLFRPR